MTGDSSAMEVLYSIRVQNLSNVSLNSLHLQELNRREIIN